MPGLPATTRRRCYWINEAQDPGVHGGYVPSVVVEGEAGHTPLLGDGTAAAPWVWGATLEAAQAACEATNARLGLTPGDVLAIRMSSMLASQTQVAGKGTWRRRKVTITPDTVATLGPVFAARITWSRADDDPDVESALSVRPAGEAVSPGWRWSYWLDSEKAADQAADYVGGVAEHDFEVIYDPAREQYAVLTDKRFGAS